ncbi:MAG: hypothetical protein B5M54_06765 [Candidatus Aminicenantes bacterium 4484_214]|nr:MAG: hypothetical protein B5M54_06765 [Candidatus Aminicenantes bacterium 4484_214]
MIELPAQWGVTSSPFIFEEKILCPVPNRLSSTHFPPWGFALSKKIVNKTEEENQIPSEPKFASSAFTKFGSKGEK